LPIRLRGILGGKKSDGRKKAKKDENGSGTNDPATTDRRDINALLGVQSHLNGKWRRKRGVKKNAAGGKGIEQLQNWPGAGPTLGTGEKGERRELQGGKVIAGQGAGICTKKIFQKWARTRLRDRRILKSVQRQELAEHSKEAQSRPCERNQAMKFAKKWRATSGHKRKVIDERRNTNNAWVKKGGGEYIRTGNKNLSVGRTLTEHVLQ